MPTVTMTNCPQCNASVSPGAEECAQCGILFSKWQQREENVVSGNTARYKVAHATSSEFNWIILIIVCTVVVGIFYYLDRANQ